MSRALLYWFLLFCGVIMLLVLGVSVKAHAQDPAYPSAQSPAPPRAVGWLPPAPAQVQVQAPVVSTYVTTVATPAPIQTVRPAGPICRALGHLGERLVPLGWDRVVTRTPPATYQTTVLAAPLYTAAPPPAYASPQAGASNYGWVPPPPAVPAPVAAPPKPAPDPTPAEDAAAPPPKRLGSLLFGEGDR